MDPNHIAEGVLTAHRPPACCPSIHLLGFLLHCKVDGQWEVGARKKDWGIVQLEAEGRVVILARENRTGQSRPSLALRLDVLAGWEG